MVGASKFVLYFFHWAILIGPWTLLKFVLKKQQSIEILEPPQNKSFYVKMQGLPFGAL
jgi:hypothetical protein